MPASRFKIPVLSLRTILFTIAVIGTIPIIAYSGLLLVRYAESERSRAERTLVETARGIARGISSQFREAEAALLTLRDAPQLIDGDLPAFEERLRRTSEQTGRHFALFERDGRQVINTFVLQGAQLARNPPERWAAVFEERRRVITDVIEGATSGRLLAGIAVPVILNGDVRYALAAGLFTKDLEVVLREGVPDDWIVSIVDRNGRHMVRSHRNDEFAGKPLVPTLVEVVKERRSGLLRTTSLEGIPLISTVQYAGDDGWAAAVGLPAATLEGPMWSSLTNLMLTGILVAALALMLALWVARRLDRAMLSLTAATTDLGRGLTVTIPPSNVKEFNAVADVLTTTSRELDTLTSSLESQVSARTAQLSETNERLKAEIARREESEARIVQMQKIEAIGQLTGGIAHDFNNMLAIVLGSLRLLQRRLARGETDVQKFIDGAIEGAERAAKLTARLLAFSRQQALAPQVIDGNKLLAGMGEILRRTIPENIQIETVLAGGLWRTFADTNGLENAIINLAVNARDAMQDGGKLTIETANALLDDAYAANHPEVTPGQYVMFAVTDTGIGMPPDVVGRAIDPFFTTKPAGQGTGLGLSQVHGFIKQSGGHVAIYSEPGQGTTVKLYLPRRFGEQQTATTVTRAESELPLARSGETVLVVEDEADVRRLTVEMLQELGYATLTAENAERALEQIDAHPEIALLMTDVVMPGANGRALATEATRRRPNLPVLFTTGYTRNAIVHHGILDPDVHVLIKPHTLEVLAVKVAELINGGGKA
jgi:signal transduction histidine kinase/CheY-like chemotaxis protein